MNNEIVIIKFFNDLLLCQFRGFWGFYFTFKNKIL